MTWAIRFEEVSKRYLRGSESYASLRQELTRAVGSIGGRLRGRRPEGRGTLALEDISFEVREGGSYAIIGPNGAGKTTALKLVSRISYPSSGTIRIRGRVGALIEVGSGIHPELTGRENVWLYGQILGIPKQQIRRRFDEIVAFSELEAALDTPVKMYSSGMQLRLGFAIASHLEPDIFVVDEALAVGDAGFQAKCVARMKDLVSYGSTLVLVSHDLQAVERLAERGLFLLDGRVEAEGPARDVLARYLEWVEHRGIGPFNPNPRKGRGSVRATSATCHDLDGQERNRFERGEGVEIRIRFSCDTPLRRPHVTLGLTDGRPGLLVQCSMLQDGAAPAHVGTEWECRWRIEELPLLPRLYQVYGDVVAEHAYGALMPWTHLTTFRIVGAEDEPMTVYSSPFSGAVDVPYSWNVSSDDSGGVPSASDPPGGAEDYDRQTGPGVASS